MDQLSNQVREGLLDGPRYRRVQNLSGIESTHKYTRACNSGGNRRQAGPLCRQLATRLIDFMSKLTRKPASMEVSNTDQVRPIRWHSCWSSGPPHHRQCKHGQTSSRDFPRDKCIVTIDRSNVAEDPSTVSARDRIRQRGPVLWESQSIRRNGSSWRTY